MLTLEEANRRGAPCRRCGGRFRVVLPREPADRLELARLSQASRMEFLRRLRAMTGCELVDAKGTMMHASASRGRCHRCSGAIGDDPLVDCPGCGALNVQLAM